MPQYTARIELTIDQERPQQWSFEMKDAMAMFAFDDWISEALQAMANEGRRRLQAGEIGDGEVHKVIVNGKGFEDNKPFFDLTVTYHKLDGDAVKTLLQLLQAVGLKG